MTVIPLTPDTDVRYLSSMDPREKPVPPAWRQPLDEWALALRAAGRSKATVRLRTTHIKMCARALRRGPWQVDISHLLRWTGTQDWATETLRSVGASLRAFYSWAVGTGYIQDSPAAGLPVIRETTPAPRPIPDSAYRSSLSTVDDRVRLILRLAAEAGLRRAEISRVHSDHVGEDLLGWTLRVHGKGGKIRTVPISDELAGLLIAQHGWAVTGLDPTRPLSAGHVGVLASNALPPGWTLHTLRHRFGTRAYAGSRDLLAVQRLLGHSRPDTTLRYVRLPDDSLRRAMEAAA